jgi:hypothetical protein
MACPVRVPGEGARRRRKPGFLIGRATNWHAVSNGKWESLCHNFVAAVWREYGLQPHRQETFKLSADPDLEDSPANPAFGSAVG